MYERPLPLCVMCSACVPRACSIVSTTGLVPETVQAGPIIPFSKSSQSSTPASAHRLSPKKTARSVEKSRLASITTTGAPSSALGLGPSVATDPASGTGPPDAPSAAAVVPASGDAPLPPLLELQRAFSRPSDRQDSIPAARKSERIVRAYRRVQCVPPNSCSPVRRSPARLGCDGARRDGSRRTGRGDAVVERVHGVVEVRHGADHEP